MNNSLKNAEVFWHTASHILAQAVTNLYADVKLAIGPAIKTGFYYDFDFPTPISMDDLKKIEDEMQRIVEADYPITCAVLSKKAAIEKMKEQPYKLELIEGIEKGVKPSFYTQGNFTDLCAGPHLPSTGYVKFFKLTGLAGAYWRGNEKNKVLTRIYGTAFQKKAELTEYLTLLEEAKKRDHNKLGRELGYFMTDEKIGQGLPLLMPKGAKLMQILQRFVEDEEQKRGYLLTKTPYMAKSDLYKISGHWQHYKDKMFVIGDEKDKDAEILALRPMTCPYQYMIYKNGLKSYRDLPVRYNETSTLFRNEASGEMHGLIRVRQFTLSEGHIICTPAQLAQEFKDCLALSYYMLDCLGLRGDVTFRFSKYDPADNEKYVGSAEEWNSAEALMKQILDELGLAYETAVGEAAFYGPKLDIQAKNVFGKEDTVITIQVDMFLAEKFEMLYTDADGVKKHPYIIHRSSIGCYERTMAMLLEKYAGALPLWLAPEQVRVLSLTERTAELVTQTAQKLNAAGFRAQTDNRNEKIGYKIREAAADKIPYMLIIGDRDAEAGVVSVRARGENGDLGQMTLNDFIQRISQEADSALKK
ncbi:MAG: threonine--tRNA ligase [Firmicutes bacterium]|nr:threonine--tRNA ligase [Bacillota bacterium]